MDAAPAGGDTILPGHQEDQKPLDQTTGSSEMLLDRTSS